MITTNQLARLWQKTEKDGCEHGLLLADGIEHWMHGAIEEIGASEWCYPRSLLRKHHTKEFHFYHTHGEWDSPLSIEDIQVFLLFSNLETMNAITETRIYTAKRIEETAIITDICVYDDLKTKYEKYLKEAKTPNRLEDDYFFYEDSFRIAILEALAKLADEYHFDLKSSKWK